MHALTLVDNRDARSAAYAAALPSDLFGRHADLRDRELNRAPYDLLLATAVLDAASESAPPL